MHLFTWLRRTPDPVGQQARWLEIMEEYDFAVEQRLGVRHVNADAISWHPCTVKSCVCEEHQSEEHLVVKSVSAQFWSLEGLRAAQRSDPDVPYFFY